MIAILAMMMRWHWLKGINFTAVAQQIALGSLPTNTLWSYVGISVGILLVTIGGAAIIMQHKKL